MKTILCYGDSNTWGYAPRTDPDPLALPQRYGWTERWPGVLRHQLGSGYQIIEEGLNARTTVWDDPISGRHKNGKTYLLPCLETHQPLDLVVLMLGTNDLKTRFSVSALDIAAGAGVLVEMTMSSRLGSNGAAPQVLLLCPPPLAKLPPTAAMFAGGESKSQELAGHYRQIAGQYGCAFLDTGEIIVSSDIDGVHLELAAHRKLGERVAELVKEILG